MASQQTFMTNLVKYHLKIEEPWTHQAKVAIHAQRDPSVDKVVVYMPVWSPGSYMVREYARHVRRFRATQSNGEFLYFEKLDKSTWVIDWSKSELNNESNEFTIEYEVYANEITVRTSHINLTHAFLHGPSLFMAIEGREGSEVELAIDFPNCWTKLTSALEDISSRREKFLYSAKNYDELIDSPIEIGNHETSGFRIQGVDHHLAFLNWPAQLPGDLRQDVKLISEKIINFWGEIPYESYTYMGHFLPKIYGGLEHHDSTVVQFDNFEVRHKEGYWDFLGLLAHEFFHTWNVKRIRPVELGPFNYRQESYTRMHWLTEGLTSFIDDLVVFNCGLSEEEYFLKRLTKKINAYLKTPGRFFDSVEEASFDAWIKLYRPHENSKNATVNYYLKGSLIFFCLNGLLHLQGRSLKDFTDLLWQHYRSNPAVGVTKDEVLKMLESLAGKAIADEFEGFISETGELPLEETCKRSGLELKWNSPEGLYWGCDFQKSGDNVLVKNVVLDGPAFKCGLNHNDEIIAFEGNRLTYSSFESWQKSLTKNHSYELLMARDGRLLKIEIAPESMPKEVKQIVVNDSKQFCRVLGAVF